MKKGFEKFKAKMENGSSGLGEMAKKYKPFFSCMGTDWWDKCKFFLAKCVAVPNSDGCLLGLSCGSRNVQKCSKLLPDLPGNMTLQSIAGEMPKFNIPGAGHMKGLYGGGMAARSGGRHKHGNDSLLA